MLTEQNLADRCGVFSASSYWKLAAGGKERQREIRRVIKERKTGEVAATPTTPEMRWGIANEAAVLAAFAAGQENIVEANNNFYKTPDGFFGATPDGFFTDGTPVEVKSPYTRIAFDKQRNKPPLRYVQQVKAQCRVMSLIAGHEIKMGYLVFGNPDDTSDFWQIQIHLEPDDLATIDSVIASAVAEVNAALTPQPTPATPSQLPQMIDAVAAANARANAVRAKAKALRDAVNKREAELLAAIREETDHPLSEIQRIVGGLPKHERPVGVRIAAKRGINITNETALPDRFCIVKRTPDKTAIKRALDAGLTVPGAERESGNDISVPAARLQIQNADIAAIEKATALISKTDKEQ